MDQAGYTIRNISFLVIAGAIAIVLFYKLIMLAVVLSPIVFLLVVALSRARKAIRKRRSERDRARWVMAVKNGECKPLEYRPPLCGRLAEGVGGTKLTADLRVDLAYGQRLSEGLRVGQPNSAMQIINWKNVVTSRLFSIVYREGPWGNAVVADQFIEMTKDMDAIDVIVNHKELSILRCYLQNGLRYIAEVIENMPSYMEASGQGAGGTHYVQNFNAAVNQGAMKIVNRDSSTTMALAPGGRSDIGVALAEIERVVISGRDLTQETRDCLLDNLKDLAEASEVSPEARRRGRVKAALESLSGAAKTSVELSRAISAWEPVLSGLLS